MSGDTVRLRQRGVENSEKKIFQEPIKGVVTESESIPSDAKFVLLLRLLFFVICFVPVLTLLLYVAIIPSQYYPVEYSLPDPPELKGSLKVNSHLVKAEKLFNGKLIGAETIVHHKGQFYTGTADGRIVRIQNGEMQTLVHLGKKQCDVHSYAEEPLCGRPLGMKFDQDGYLIVIDSYSGLYRVNVATREVHLLLPTKVLVDGRPLNFLNSLDISSDGMIYLTDSSVFQRRDYMLDLLDGRPTGRLLRYDPVKNATEVLVENIRFANGVQLSRYEDFILVCETYAARILKYNIKGINAGRTEVFAENLPGIPDNIRSSASGGFWVGLPMVRHQEKLLNSLDFLAPRTFLRFCLSWLAKILDFTPPSGTMIVEFNGKGEIVRTLMDLNGENVQWITEVEDVTGVLYLGSFREPYLARIDASHLK